MIDVACAIIVNTDDTILVAQRSGEMSLPLKMEFPGGKVEAGETATDCVVREIKEELNLDILPLSQLVPSVHAYPNFTIRLIPFICQMKGGEIRLKEHLAYAWLTPAKLLDLDWADADIPIVKSYLNMVNY